MSNPPCGKGMIGTFTEIFVRSRLPSATTTPVRPLLSYHSGNDILQVPPGIASMYRKTRRGHHLLRDQCLTGADPRRIHGVSAFIIIFATTPVRQAICL